MKPTPRLIQLLVKACQAAEKQGRSYYSVSDFFLVMLEDGEAAPTQVLKKEIGSFLPQIREQIKKMS